MSIGYLLVWLVAFSSGALILQLLRNHPRRNLGWLIVHLFILGVMGTLCLQDREMAGYIGGELWFLLVLVPGLMLRRVQALLLDTDYARARRLSHVLAVLHPMDGWTKIPKLIRGLELDAVGKTAEADAIMASHLRSGNTLSRTAIAGRMAQAGEWEKIVEWVRSTTDVVDFRREPSVLGAYLRALGETGQLDLLVQTAFEAQRLSEVTGLSAQARLFLSAFCGQSEDVALLFAGPLRLYPRELREFWIATSEMAAGRRELAMITLLDLAGRAPSRHQRGIHRRLQYETAVAAAVLSEKSWLQLRAINEDWRAHGRLRNLQGTGSGRRPYATYALIGINVLVFGLEAAQGGTTNLDTLYTLGALVVEPGTWPEYWRLLASTFLHYGPVHLGMNMLALYVLGPFVEHALGKLRFLACYIGSGLLSMMVVCLLARFLREQILVGASGSIMGMVGATVAILFNLWRHDRSRGVMRRLQSTLGIIVFQCFFDLSTKEVSMTAHLGGVFFGFLLAVTMRPSFMESAQG